MTTVVADPDIARPGWRNVAGIGRRRHWEIGQITTNARPMTSLTGTKPLSRESLESSRWSPMTNRSPLGTTTVLPSKPSAEQGCEPG